MTYIVAISAYLVLLTIFGLIVARKKVKTRSEERRVGKECRSRWGRERKKKRENGEEYSANH